jgi:hypothetical protein
MTRQKKKGLDRSEKLWERDKEMHEGRTGYRAILVGLLILSQYQLCLSTGNIPSRKSALVFIFDATLPPSSIGRSQGSQSFSINYRRGKGQG